MYQRNLLFTLGLLGLFSFSSSAQCGANYDEQVQKIVSKANHLPHHESRIVFAGSSTFRLWENMAESFPNYEVINAGIGGSCFEDLYAYREELISATNPDILVIYEGDNDIAHQYENHEIPSSKGIVKHAYELFLWIKSNHPEMEVIFLSPKPSPLRWKYRSTYFKINQELEKLCTDYFGFKFVNCWPDLTDDNGDVLNQYFQKDQLHLNNIGNEVIGRLINLSLDSPLDTIYDDFINQWHLAAATADSATYFGAFFNNASIFQGTDGSEYWTAEEFRNWAAPYFRRKSAWTFEAFERHWYSQGNTMWFNERLNSPHMGKCRGVGVVRMTSSGPKIDHYSLSFEVPNQVVNNLVALADSERVEVLKYQKELDDFYTDSTTSPLKREERISFHGHEFFEYNPSFKVEADINILENEPWFDMATSSGKSRKYRRYALATFDIDGKSFQLVLYQSQRLMKMEEYKDHLFLPFTDLNTGISTYGTGRFMDVSIPKGNSVVLDFNYAYNPYCAYTDGYSCPITPKENFIDIHVNAGIKGPNNH
jgi:uncharacterized protein (DUF1684 family)/lysophospholipase L1-like esterase